MIFWRTKSDILLVMNSNLLYIIYMLGKRGVTGSLPFTYFGLPIGANPKKSWYLKTDYKCIGKKKDLVGGWIDLWILQKG